LRGIAETSARAPAGRKQSAMAPKQASPSESHLSTPGRELLGTQLVPARYPALEI
jgi:hypothetical protein